MLFGVGVGVASAVAMPSVVLAVLLLLPALAVCMLAPSAARPLARAILLAGIAGALPAIAALLRAGGDVSMSLDLARDPAKLGTAWAAQAGGWLVAEAAPAAIRLWWAIHDRARVANLRAERARIEAAWSPPPDARP